MADEQEQIAVRRGKLAGLRASGANAFPNDFVPDHAAAEVHARFAALDETALAKAEPVCVAGRIVAKRMLGKATFVHIQDGGARLQLHLRRDLLGDDYATVKTLDLGDLVGVQGRPFRTRTGELTLQVGRLRLLTKCLRPLPEKWHGLQDVEMRHRRRYLDLIVNPDVRDVFETRSRVIRYLREYLTARGFVEVETPMMQAVAGGAAARPFVTHHNALDVDLYLRIAPELYLKRLIVGGLDRVFELGRVFRNEGVSTRHNPEFTLLEFYQAYATYDDLMDLTEAMFVGCAETVAGRLLLDWGGDRIDLTPPWPRRTMAELVAERAKTTVEALLRGNAVRALAERTGGIERASMSNGELLGICFERLVEPHLVQPTFVCQFPVEVSPLARRNDADPRFVDRFELFVGRQEMANAFSELNDPEDQRARFEAQLVARAAGDDEAHLMDEDYVCALEYGLPPTAGEGVGVDRLVMLLTGMTSIREVILFPYLRPETRS
jgi:lysyl-tRNA synthetase class 2